ncbi:hypothetical protein BKH30_00215, partial [Actinomyces oris]
PNLARSLKKLAKLLCDAERTDEALDAARKATALYRSFTHKHPSTFSRDLADALDTYANILERSGNTKEAAHIRQERDEVLKRIEEMEAGDN